VKKGAERKRGHRPVAGKATVNRGLPGAERAGPTSLHASIARNRGQMTGPAHIEVMIPAELAPNSPYSSLPFASMVATRISYHEPIRGESDMRASIERSSILRLVPGEYTNCRNACRPKIVRSGRSCGASDRCSVFPSSGRGRFARIALALQEKETVDASLAHFQYGLQYFRFEVAQRLSFPGGVLHPIAERFRHRPNVRKALAGSRIFRDAHRYGLHVRFLGGKRPKAWQRCRFLFTPVCGPPSLPPPGPRNAGYTPRETPVRLVQGASRASAATLRSTSPERKKGPRRRLLRSGIFGTSPASTAGPTTDLFGKSGRYCP